jgi:hypothetical protein
LRGLLGGVGRLASKLVGGSSIRGDIGQSRTTEPGPQLKTLLQCLPVLLVGRIFNGDSVITLADFTAFLSLVLALLWNIYKPRRGSWVGDKLCNVTLQQMTWVNVTTSL